MRVILALVAVILSACRSDSGSDLSTAPPITVSPSSATVTSRLPKAFVLSGGTAPYVVSSSNEAVVPNPSVSNSAFLVFPRPVAADTVVRLTVRDSGTAPPTVVSVTVKPLATTPLSAQPSRVAFQGHAPGTCANGTVAEVMVYGGAPPYSVSQPAAFAVLPILVSANPGSFTIRTSGQCSMGSQIAVTDSAGASAVVTVSNTLASPPTPAPRPLTVSPTFVTIPGCDDVGTVTFTGGLPVDAYFANGLSPAVLAVGHDYRGWIVRAPGPQSAHASAVQFSDGVDFVEVAVVLPDGPRLCQ